MTLATYLASLSFWIFSSNIDKRASTSGSVWGLNEKTQAPGPVNDSSLSFPSSLDPSLTHPPSWLLFILWILLAVTPYVLGSMLEVLRLRLYLDALALLFFIPLCCYGDGWEGSKEDSRKGRMELSHEDQQIGLGMVPGELLLPEDPCLCMLSGEATKG